MKKILKLIMGLGVLLATGCAKDLTTERYDPSTENPEEAYFKSPTMSHAFPMGSGNTATLDVKIYRANNTGDVTVGLNYNIPSDTRDVFDVIFPDEVSFKDGEYETTIPVKINGIDNFVKGVSYTANISVGDHHDFKEFNSLRTIVDKTKPKQARTRAMDVIKYSSLTLTLSLELQWEQMYIMKDATKLLDYDSLTEDDFKKDDAGELIPLTAYAADMFGEEVECLVERASGTNVFRLKNFQWDDYSEPIDVIWSIETTKDLVDGMYYQTSLGFTYWGYYDDTQDVYVSDINSTILASSNFPGVVPDDYPCIWDGENEFLFTAVFIVYTHDGGIGGWWGAPSGWTMAIEFSIGETPEPEPAVSIDYSAVTTDMGVKTFNISFTPNSDVAEYYATVLKLDSSISAAALESAKESVGEMLTADLEEIGITPDMPEFEMYYNYYFDSYYDAYFGEFYVEALLKLESEAVEDLVDEAKEAIESGEFASEYPLLHLTEADSRAWNLGDESAELIAVAFSYDEKGKVSGTDYKVFSYNPNADPSMVFYYLEFTPYYEAPYYGCFADNSIDFYMEALRDDITSVTYAVLSEEEFDEAGLSWSSSDAELKAYLNKNGKSFSRSDLQDVNHHPSGNGYYDNYIAAESNTAYYLITCVANADAEKIEIFEAQTSPSYKHSPLNVRTVVTDALAANRIYSHTHAIGVITGSYVSDGAYLAVKLVEDEDNANKLITTDEELNDFVTINADGTISLKNGVDETKLISYIAKEGTALTAAASTSADLYVINTGSQVQKTVSVGPHTSVAFLAVAEFSDGSVEWMGAWNTTNYAPDVKFTQTATANGKNIQFNWTGSSQASIYYTTAITYALVPYSELTAAGVDTSMLTDEALNNFDRRKDEGTAEATIAAQKANAALVNAVLAANGKVFTGDRALYTVNNGGFSGVFENQSAGDYALIALAKDSYNTKLTVAKVTVQ